MKKSFPLWVPVLILAILLLGGGLFFATNNHIPQPQPTPTEAPLIVVLPTEVPTETPIPTVPPTPTPVVRSAVDYFLEHTSQQSYEEWIRRFSGEEPVTVDGSEVSIKSRYSYAMFGGKENAKAYEYLIRTLKQYVPEEMITSEPYTYSDSMSSYTWYNVVVTFPGTVSPDEQILYTAHYDSCVSTSGRDPMELAPGADDNATGLAALLEAMPTFAATSFDRTLKVVFFSGEENFQEGSKAYAVAHQHDNIVGVLNMDMFGNDADNDRCFEIHVGTIQASDGIGRAVAQAVADYDLNLTYDYFPYEIHENKIQGDHTSFWNLQIPAVTVMENFSSAASDGGCGAGIADPSPNWHTDTDFIVDVNIPYAFDISRTGTIAALNLAGAHEITITD